MIGIAKTMYCFVKLPNSVVLDVDVDPKADAQECLHKVLEHLNIIESDYFGLQYTIKDGCPTWLNLRNPIDQQLGLVGPAPYRLSLRVKFFVQPHRLLQAATRHQFYLNVKQDLRDGRLRLMSSQQLVELAAHIAQAEHGDFNASMGQQYTHLLPGPGGGGGGEEGHDAEVLAGIAQAHAALRGVQGAAAEYRALQAAAHMHCYGMEYFTVALEPSAINELYGNRGNKHIKGQGQHIIGVGPEGVFLYNAKWKQKRMFAYPSVHRITSCTRSFSLVVFRDDANSGTSSTSSSTAPESTIDVRLASRVAAGALYRCVTEMYCFYLCETVRDNVVTQFSRDLKGTLASLFNENSTVGKKYTFDIRRTANEAYDFYRRTLYKAGLAVDGGVMLQGEVVADTGLVTKNNGCGGGTTKTGSAPQGECCAALREQVSALQDAVLCVVCADAPLAVLFAPCRHVVCCEQCARRIDTCPVCRTRIDDCQPIYMPSVPSASSSLSVNTTTTTTTASTVEEQTQQLIGSSASKVAVVVSHL